MHSLESQKAAVLKVIRNIESLSKELDRFHALPENSESCDNIPFPNAVCISGRRGTGKTTILHKATTKLRQDSRYLTLPVLDANLVSGIDSLRHAILAIFRNFALNKVIDEDARFESSESLMRIQEGLAANDNIWKRATASLSIGRRDYAKFSEERSTMRSNFAPMLNEWINNTLETAGAEKMILPIDDVDLTPSRSTDLIQVLHELQYCDSLVVLFATNLEELRERVEGFFLQIGIEPSDRTAREAYYIVAKIVPLQWVCPVIEFPPHRRVTFPNEEFHREISLEKIESASLSPILIHLGALPSSKPQVGYPEALQLLAPAFQSFYLRAYVP